MSYPDAADVLADVKLYQERTARCAFCGRRRKGRDHMLWTGRRAHMCRPCGTLFAIDLFGLLLVELVSTPPPWQVELGPLQRWPAEPTARFIDPHELRGAMRRSMGAVLRRVDPPA